MTSSLKTKDITLPRTGVLPDIRVRDGESLLLLGPSGCGKTTMLNVLAGLLRPQSGEVWFQDKAYSALSLAQIDAMRGRHFGFIFQRVHLIGHLSIAQNIALSFAGAGLKVDQFRVSSLIKDLGLESLAGAKANTLSQGQAQRVEIARAIVHSPQIVFADEPTSALDDVNAQSVMDLLFSYAIKSGASLIVSTHDSRIKSRFKSILEMGV